MKIRLLSSLLGLLLTSNVFANDENDKYFIAYNASQTSKLPDVLKKQMQSFAMLDQIAVETLKKMGQTQLATAYYDRPDLQNNLRPLVRNFITSKNGGELFDDASTKLFSTIYSVDELKTLYQNNKSSQGQKFVIASMNVDLTIQEFINNAYKQKFDESSIDQLEADIQKIYTKYRLNQEPLHTDETSTPPRALKAENVATQVQSTVTANKASENTAALTSIKEERETETVTLLPSSVAVKETTTAQDQSSINENKASENTAALTSIKEERKTETVNFVPSSVAVKETNTAQVQPSINENKASENTAALTSIKEERETETVTLVPSSVAVKETTTAQDQSSINENKASGNTALITIIEQEKTDGVASQLNNAAEDASITPEKDSFLNAAKTEAVQIDQPSVAAEKESKVINNSQSNETNHNH